MDRDTNIRLLYLFIRIFTVLVVILLIMPLLVEQAMYFFNQSIIPDANSVNVFTDPSKMHVTVFRFIEIVEKAFIEALY